MLPEDFVTDVIAHMNSDHADSLRDYAIAFGGLDNPEQVELVGINETHMRMLCTTNSQVSLIDTD